MLPTTRRTRLVRWAKESGVKDIRTFLQKYYKSHVTFCKDVGMPYSSFDVWLLEKY